jgi:hypothetical protein
LDDDAFKTTSKEECKLSHEKQWKCFALSECIAAINNKSFTPFHLCLALQVYLKLKKQAGVDNFPW